MTDKAEQGDDLDIDDLSLDDLTPEQRERISQVDRAVLGPIGDSNWRDHLVVTKHGPKRILLNVVSALRFAPEFAGKIRLDEFAGTIASFGTPWRESEARHNWGDTDDSHLACWLQDEAGLTVASALCNEAVRLVANDDSFHPVCDWLDGLQWDGIHRLNNLFIDYFGAETCRDDDADNTVAKDRTDYIMGVGRCFLKGGVARAYEPGCKVDTAPILEGMQGIGKSAGIAALLPESDWFADDVGDLSKKDAAESIQGKLIIELAELSAIRRIDQERVKAFITRQVDYFRPAYGRTAKNHPRQCVFVGSTNQGAYLDDETGNRRFLPVRCQFVDMEAIQRDRDQLWAEAVAAYKKGEKWWLSDDTVAVAMAEQARRQKFDPWDESVIEKAYELISENTAVAVPAILRKLGFYTHQQEQKHANRVARVLVRARWKRGQNRVDGKLVWNYRPPKTDDSESAE